MAVQDKFVTDHALRDTRTMDDRVAAILSATPLATAAVVLLAVIVLVFPWAVIPCFIVAFFWWATVSGDIDRQTLPLYLPKEANRIDYNDRLPGLAGAKGRYGKAAGFFFTGNAYSWDRGGRSRFSEIWENASFARRHVMLLGTTGSGKTETLMGFLANYMLCGSGIIFSDAKGTIQQIYKNYWLSRRFGRDDDTFFINYIESKYQEFQDRKRSTNTSNPLAFAPADQINEMFKSLLPPGSGDNQVFQDRAVAMFTSVTPALVELRDVHKHVIGLNDIRKYTGSLKSLLELSQNPLLSDKTRESLKFYIDSGLGMDPDRLAEYIGTRDPITGKFSGGKKPLPQDASKSFAYASQFFLRAMTSLVESYGSIYLVDRGEVNYEDAIFNGRIVVIALPALTKSLSELNNIAKINVSNIRGAIASASSGNVEGSKEDNIDSMPTNAEFPSLVGLDEYGYQKTDGFAITMAQARGLNFQIVVAGQDFSNFTMGDKGGNGEAEAIFGNSVLRVMNIRNLHELGQRVQEIAGEVDVGVVSSMERQVGLGKGGYLDEKQARTERRNRITASDLFHIPGGSLIMFPGGGLQPIRLACFAPLPPESSTTQINRFLSMPDNRQIDDPLLLGAVAINLMSRHLLEGAGKTIVGFHAGSGVNEFLAALAKPSEKPGQENWAPGYRALMNVLDNISLQDTDATPGTATRGVVDPGTASPLSYPSATRTPLPMDRNGRLYPPTMTPPTRAPTSGRYDEELVRRTGVDFLGDNWDEDQLGYQDGLMGPGRRFKDRYQDMERRLSTAGRTDPPPQAEDIPRTRGYAPKATPPKLSGPALVEIVKTMRARHHISGDRRHAAAASARVARSPDSPAGDKES